MRDLGFTLDKTDSVLWMKVCTRDNCIGQEKDYSCVSLCWYTCILNDTNSVWKQLDKYFPMKPNSVREPDTSLGAKLKAVHLGKSGWAQGPSSSKWMQEAIQECKKFLDQNLPKYYNYHK